ncbi:DUF5004 domain-containing protein [Cryomorphaceae bacterium]|nr:DUF5004 domain-containing protein [Cryomorphaceae bacterium]
MKRQFSIAALVALFIGVASCRPDIPSDIGPSYDATSGFSGKWRLSQVDMVDKQEALQETRDITPFYASDFGAVTLSGGEGTYTVEEGAGDFFIGTQGTYSFDDPSFPSNIIFYTDAGDTVTASLSRMVREIDNDMGFNVPREKCDAPSVQYNFSFTRE